MSAYWLRAPIDLFQLPQGEAILLFQDVIDPALQSYATGCHFYQDSKRLDPQRKSRDH